VRSILRLLVFIYQMISPAFHYLSFTFGYPGCCRFPESCSHYAARQLMENNSMISAIYLIIRRLLSCGPWGNLQHNFWLEKRKGSR